MVDGLPADVVNFSLEPDMSKVVKAGLVSSSWDNGPTKGMVTDSIVSFIVRPGNPKHITTWADLVKSGVQVDHAQRLQLGQRQVEPHGGLRRRDLAGQVAGAGPGLPLEAAAQRRGPALERQRRAADLPRRAG